MSENKLQNRFPSSVREKGQYFLAFGVVASMLLVANFPFFVVFFFGIFAFFLVRMFSAGSRNETRDIFEFYLSANEILRDDERKWFGFEIKDAIMRGEGILHRMSGAPPLVYFTLGALYNKIGDHKAAVSNLSYVVENETADELTYAFPSPELRTYVKVLRKIERDPADAPLTSAAVRALERARKLRAKNLLEQSRSKSSKLDVQQLNGSAGGEITEIDYSDQSAERPERRSITDDTLHSKQETRPTADNGRLTNNSAEKKTSKRTKEDPFSNRKPITEVLHDIYDKNVQ
ncbi:MAG: hypothetical protein H7070_10925 [Saprospiraceae bacterium]|nr:hypothetical protein [Pyrinomonadaceae bacterium]